MTSRNRQAPAAGAHRSRRRRVERLAAAAAAGIVILLIWAGSATAATTADFTFAPAKPNVAQTVTFTGSATTGSGVTITSWAWSFGDGGSASGQSATHTFAASGDMPVTLTVTDSTNATASATHTVHVNVPPTAGIVFSAFPLAGGQDPHTPFVGQQVAFSGTPGSTDPDGSIVSYAWDLGDGGGFGAPSANAGIVATYPTAGTRTVQLRVTDDAGAHATASVTFNVVDRAPVAGFTWTPQSPTTGQSVTFTSTSTDPDGDGDIVSQQWDLGSGGNFSDASGPTATANYAHAGDYHVRLKVTDRSGMTSVSDQVVSVHDTRPSAGFAYAVGPAAPGPGPVQSASSSSRLTVVAGVRVQMAGSVSARGTRITRFVINAPTGATVTVRCRGRGCPAHALRRRGGRHALRFAALERTFAPGTHITVIVAKTGSITKVISFTIQKGRPPRRSEQCLAPKTNKAGRCPA